MVLPQDVGYFHPSGIEEEKEDGKKGKEEEVTGKKGKEEEEKVETVTKALAQLSLPPSSVPVYVSLALSGETTRQLVDCFSALNQGIVYKVVRGLKDPAHVTLGYFSDFPSLQDFAEWLGASVVLSSGADTKVHF